MEIDIKGGGWRRRASAVDSGDGQRRRVLAFDGGNGRQLWHRWTIKTTAFNGGSDGGVQWRQQCSMAFDGVGDGLRREDEGVAQGQATQTRGRCFKKTTRDDGATTSWHDKTMRGGTMRRQDNKRVAH